MTDQQRAAMQAALEAITELDGYSRSAVTDKIARDAKQQLRAALAEQEATHVRAKNTSPERVAETEKREHIEPVALLHTGAMYGNERDEYEIEVNSHEWLERFCDQHPGQTIPLFDHPPKAEQEAEPVAWMYRHESEPPGDGRVTTLRWGFVTREWIETPLYTHQPRREWKGLTDEEREQFVQWMHPDVLARVEQALRGKNGGGE